MRKRKWKAVRPRKRKAPAPKAARKESATGTYMLDKETGRLVKVSGRIPGLSKAGRDGSLGGEGDDSGADSSDGGDDFE